MSWSFYPHLVIIAISLLFFSGELQWLRPADGGYLLLMGGVSALGGICLARAFAFARTATAASFHYVQMLWGVGLGYFIFGETVDLWTAVGAMVIIAGGLWLIRVER
jgi:drug/metabolite transporter (DMT)-like permease